MATLNRARLAVAPGFNLDDRLRTLPGFTLLRRSSSLVAHPTTQGVSLRGIGSNGASRTLALWDGAPLNSPSGGWIYWTRIPVEEIEEAQTLPGSSAGLFGDRAMGGVIALRSREPAERASKPGVGALRTLMPASPRYAAIGRFPVGDAHFVPMGIMLCPPS